MVLIETYSGEYNNLIKRMYTKTVKVLTEHEKLKHTVKPVLSSHSKLDVAMVLKTNGSLMKVKSIAECSLGAFCNTLT